MTLLSDFEVIRKNAVVIGEGTGPLVVKFSTGGVNNTLPAILLFAVSGLTIVDPATAPQVKVNGVDIGRISPYPGSSTGELTEESMAWYTQHLVIPSTAKLDPVNANGNTLEITRADLGIVLQPPNPNPGQFDDFQVRDIVCFFRQPS
ncbi:hypothetical protein [Umezawaea beigongshangensis]|uniref:hypothetical protein n=1 Tax=Umezawaea beigongshangensis TaxID=2780383 RepID=UPI0018F1AA64|nr:hypothetical protein [Umezawaea beigongshangensis]